MPFSPPTPSSCCPAPSKVSADPERFRAACRKAGERRRADRGIGTYAEQTLHAALKNYYETETCFHEVRIAGYIADIVTRDAIIEIQTGGMDKLHRKLAALLETGLVIVAHPVARQRWLLRVDPLTGEILSRRRSPRIGTLWSMFDELYKIKSLLRHPNLHLRILLIDVEDVRLTPGRGRRLDRIPFELADEIAIDTPADYAALLPPCLAETFTSGELAAAAGIRRPEASLALHVLAHVGALGIAGKRGHSLIYHRSAGADADSAGESLPESTCR